MGICRDTVVTEARTWLGTRFAHQGRRKISATQPGGVDCLGYILGVAAAVGMTCRDGKTFAQFDDVTYSKQPDGVVLQRTLAEHLTPLQQAWVQPGDIGLFMFDDNPQHLGIFTNYAAGGLGIIHAYAPARKVVEHAFDAAWQKRLVAGYGTGCA